MEEYLKRATPIWSNLGFDIFPSAHDTVTRRPGDTGDIEKIA